MRANTRIIVNVVVTYGRSLLSLVCGLFTSRWLLAALGKEDFGLYGVIGAMMIFITFINTVISTSLVRYYAYAIGEMDVDQARGLENCRKWFSIAFVLHSLIPLALMCIGYPVGIYVIRYFLAIPPGKTVACLWVFRITCLSCFVGMLTVPFSAMYTAKQKIAEITLYAMGSTLISFFGVYYMSCHAGNWLVPYSALMCLTAILPNILVVANAALRFPECKFVPSFAMRWGDMRSLLAYSGWQAYGSLACIMRAQGLAILVNRWFGAVVNAGMTIGNQVNAQTTALQYAMQGAFAPAITSAFAAGKIEFAKRMSFFVTKFGMFLVVACMLPIALELRQILVLWLVTPPDFAYEFCITMMIMLVCEKLTIGHMIMINATGKVALYQFLLGSAILLTVPLVVVMYFLGAGRHSICLPIIISAILCSAIRLALGARCISVSVCDWAREALMPCSLVCSVPACVGLSVVLIMESSFVRIPVVILAVEGTMLPLVWYVGLRKEEKCWALETLAKKVPFLRSKSVRRILCVSSSH